MYKSVHQHLGGVVNLVFLAGTVSMAKQGCRAKLYLIPAPDLHEVPALKTVVSDSRGLP